MKFMLVVVLLVAGAWFLFKPLPPGKGPEAEKGKRVATVVAGAIESYRGARGIYPDDLDGLVPDFLAGVPKLSNGSSMEYQRLGNNFKLTFNYSNPLPVHCTIQQGTKWDCEWF